MASLEREKGYWKKQWLGVLAGGALGLALGVLFPGLPKQFGGLLSLVLWSGVIGSVLTNLNGFVRAGAALTHSENRGINLLVGLGIPVLIVVLFGIAISSLK
ncbi:MAG TPA: hypothetical protein VFZ76_14610 [Anaerolineales bacterium]